MSLVYTVVPLLCLLHLYRALKHDYDRFGLLSASDASSIKYSLAIVKAADYMVFSKHFSFNFRNYLDISNFSKGNILYTVDTANIKVHKHGFALKRKKKSF